MAKAKKPITLSEGTAALLPHERWELEDALDTRSAYLAVVAENRRAARLTQEAMDDQALQALHEKIKKIKKTRGS